MERNIGNTCYISLYIFHLDKHLCVQNVHTNVSIIPLISVTEFPWATILSQVFHFNCPPSGVMYYSTHVQDLKSK